MLGNITPALLADLRVAFAPSPSGYMATTFTRDGVTYQSNGNPGWGMDANGAEPATGFYAYITGRTAPGDAFSMYRLADGAYLGDGIFRDAGSGLALLAVAIAAAVGAAAFLPGITASGAALPGFATTGATLGAGGGYGIVGGATEPVASLALGGETIAGTVATGTAAAATATGTASTLSTAASVLSPLAKIAAVAAPLLGLAPSGSTAPGAPLQRAPQPRAITPAEPASPLLLLAAGALAFLTLKG